MSDADAPGVLNRNTPHFLHRPTRSPLAAPPPRKSIHVDMSCTRLHYEPRPTAQAKEAPDDPLGDECLSPVCKYTFTLVDTFVQTTYKGCFIGRK